MTVLLTAVKTMPRNKIEISALSALLIVMIQAAVNNFMPSCAAQSKSQALLLFERAQQENNSVKTLQVALKDIDQALALDPKNAAFWHQKASILMHMEENEAALPCIEKSIQLKPHSAEALECKAFLLNGLQRNEEALKTIDQAMKISATRPVRVTRAQILMSMLQFDQAEKELDLLVAQNGNDVIARTRRAITALHLKHYNKEIEDLTVLLKLTSNKTPSYGNHLCERAEAYLKIKEYDKAIADYKAGLETSERRQYHAGLIEAYEAKGDRQAAAIERKKLSSLDEDIVPFK